MSRDVFLAGIAQCGACGGGLVVETYKTSAGKPRGSHYVCARRRANGKCENALRIPVEEMHAAVLYAVEEHALTPEAVESVILLSEKTNRADARKPLEREAADVAKRIARLVAAIEDGADVASLVAQLRKLEARGKAIAEELADLRPVPRLPEGVVEDRLAEWRRLLRANVATGRSVLEKVLAGRIVFTPNAKRDGYDFEAPTRFDRLFSGVALAPVKLKNVPEWVLSYDPSSEAPIGPEETMEGDYGRILERAVRKLANRMTVASPPGFEPGFQP